jgi:hypothetical protein
MQLPTIASTSSVATPQDPRPIISFPDLQSLPMKRQIFLKYQQDLQFFKSLNEKADIQPKIIPIKKTYIQQKNKIIIIPINDLPKQAIPPQKKAVSVEVKISIKKTSKKTSSPSPLMEKIIQQHRKSKPISHTPVAYTSRSGGK